MKNLDRKTVLVCGGATGIGAATVRRLAQEGARLVIGDLNVQGAEQLAAELGADGADISALAYDQSEEASINTLVAAAQDRLGVIDGLFANVADIDAVQIETDVLGNDYALWQRTLNVNLVGTAMLLKAALPAMLERGSGAFVLTSSDAHIVGEAERPAYAASKAGVNTLARHIATKWGTSGIRCNVVSPGFVLTEQMNIHMPQEMKDRMLKGVPSTRHGQPEDIAGAVAYLLSDDAQWINGQVWRVNGGVTYGN